MSASLAEELLENYTGAGSGDKEEHIIIGRDRYITIPESLKKIGVQYDHNIETLIFDCPRMWDDIDLSTLNIFINYLRSDGTPGSHDATPSITLDAENENIFHFEWKVSQNVTLTDGMVGFLICAKAPDDTEDNVAWHTELNTDAFVSPGLDTHIAVENLYPDIINQLLGRMDSVEEKFDVSRMIVLEQDVANIKDGSTPAKKAECDAEGNNIAGTYATKEEVQSVTGGAIQETLNNIVNGTTTVGKAVADENGNNIAGTYATKEEVSNTTGGQLESAISNIVNGTTTVGKAVADGEGKVIKDTYATKEELSNVSSEADSKYPTKTEFSSVKNTVNGITGSVEEWVLTDEHDTVITKEVYAKTKSTKLNGWWLLNPTLSGLGVTGWTSENVSFTSNGTTFTSIQFAVLEKALYYGSTAVYSAQTNTWTDEAYRTVIFDNASCSANFYSFLAANGDTYVTISGTWVFKNEIDTTGIYNKEYNFNFTSNGESYDGMFSLASSKLGFMSGSDSRYFYDQGIGGTGWTNEAYRTITFDGTQYVTKEFFEWFKQNTE